MTTEATAFDHDRIDNGGLAAEEMPSLVDFADEPGGAWPLGWYAATVLEGYGTRTGKNFVTGDEPSKDGSSRNLRLCLSLDGGPLGSRNHFETFNYRVEDFTPARLAQIKEMREQFKGARGAWPGQADAQRTSLAIANLGQLEKALGFRLKRTEAGHLNARVFIGHKVDVRLGMDKEDKYNEVKAYAPAGSRTGKK